jgi:hypothetical protein
VLLETTEVNAVPPTKLKESDNSETLSVPVSPEIESEEDMFATVATVITPLLLTVRTGTSVELP